MANLGSSNQVCQQNFERQMVGDVSRKVAGTLARSFLSSTSWRATASLWRFANGFSLENIVRVLASVRLAKTLGSRRLCGKGGSSWRTGPGMTDPDRASTRTRATNDPQVNNAIGRILEARRKFEVSLVADRLALISAFHESKALGIELVRMREALAYQRATPDPRETSEERARNDAVNECHVTSLESRRKNAATALIIAIDRLTDPLWMKLGLPEWSVRGGKIVSGGVTVIELIHLCGNYLRHAHEWMLVSDLKPRAKKNIERLQLVGLDCRDDGMLARVVEALPYPDFISLEVDLLDFMEFISWFTQEKVISVWAAEVGETYAIRFNTYDDQSGYGQLAVELNREVGPNWKLPSL